VARRALTSRFAAAATLAAFGVLTACRPPPGGSQATTRQETAVTTSSAADRPTNRLSRATSPYLQQHAHNPVDWYEWGPEALAAAAREQKPIFLSIGYSACHWCHVMAHESFEDPEIAALMNGLFINIKVDREERPDLDEIYMQATMILNHGQGGWPMSVWLTPDLKPFYAGTYFPPDDRYGRVGFKALCARIGELWNERREAIAADAERLSDYVRQSLRTTVDDSVVLTLEHVDAAADMLGRAFDPTHGGIPSGGVNKFPPSMAMQLMLRSAVRRRDDAARRQRLVGLIELTLERMARGGIFDHLEGGIARYSTDVRWHVPHFEKMLYDQALVSAVCVEAHLALGRDDFRDAARAILDYVLADLQSPAGGFYSARDADSEGEEGKYYVWTKAEIDAVLGADSALFCGYYDVSESGNWSDPHAPGVPKNVLHAPRDVSAVARLHRLSASEAERRLAAARRRLLDQRRKRTPPHRDEKILCEWNGLMISSLARAGAALDEPRYTAAAVRAAEFVLTHQRRDGRLLRAWREGRTLDMAFLGDYACLIEGLLDLYEATFEKRWLEAAIELNRTVVEHYADAEGGFFHTSADHERLVTRVKDVRDSASPSGNSVQLMNLLRLAAVTDDPQLRERAQRTIAVFSHDVATQPGSGERFLQAVEFALAGPVEIAVVGAADAPETRALLRVIYESYVPNRVLMLSDPRKPQEAPDSPLLRGRTLVDGRPAVYICRNYACQRPITDAGELRSALRGSR
jgi:uncharacterized protein YyaL (SSP411 family)